jgi:hypothetical protein
LGEYGPSVLDGKVRYLSASQLQSFDAGGYGGCARRWWFRNVAKKPERATKATDLGTKVHAQVEHYLRTGEDVLGEIARAGRRFIPKPGPDLLVEFGFGTLVGDRVESVLKSAGVPFVGRIDLMHARGEWIDDDGARRDEPGGTETIDWKSTAQIESDVDEVTGIVRRRGYAKSGEELAKTWQMLGYGVVGLALWPGAKSVRSSHGYFQTKGRREASKRSAVMSAAKVREGWAASEPIVEQVKSAAGESKVEALPANYSACNAYGGCPHRAYCPRDANHVLAEMFGRGAAMGILDKIQGKSSAASAAPSGTTPAVTAEMEKLRAEEKALKSKASATPPDMPAPSSAAPAVAKSEPEQPKCVTCGETSTRAIQDADGLKPYCAKHEPGAAAPPAEVGPCPRTNAQIDLTIDEVASKKRACDCGATVKVKPTKLGDKYCALIPKHDRPGTPKPTPEPAKIKVTVVGDDGTKTILNPESGGPGISVGADEPTPDTTAPPTSKQIVEYSKVEPAAPAPAGLTLYLDAIEDGVAYRCAWSRTPIEVRRGVGRAVQGR